MNDIYTTIAALLNDVPEEDVTKSMREDAKAKTFAHSYGAPNGQLGKYLERLQSAKLEIKKDE